MNTNKISDKFEEDVKNCDNIFGVDLSFDLKRRTINVSGRRGVLWYIETITNSQLISNLVRFLLASDIGKADSDEIVNRFIGVGECIEECDIDKANRELMGGNCVLLVEGCRSLILINARATPSRSTQEPENDKVLRGSHDGFVENIAQNVGILRCRLKSSGIIFKKIEIGELSPTNVIVCAVKSKADPKYLKTLEEKLYSIKTDTLAMGQESLAECLVDRKWYNPFPKFRYTERPDSACAMLMEGSVLIFVDGSPQAMILPCSIIDFLQESDDFYFPPIIGTYLRILRMSVFFIALFLTPVWYLITRHPDVVPPTLSFVLPTEEQQLPIIIQLILTEFTIDWLKLASLNTPNTLSGSLSIVAGLIIGDFAIEVGWLTPHVILYMSFAAMANFTQPSFELGYAFKFMRIILLILTWLFDFLGFVVGCALITIFICTNKSADGSRNYLYPLIPFNFEALKRQFFRVRKKNQGKK